jgi:hypothetical protein
LRRCELDRAVRHRPGDQIDDQRLAVRSAN